MQPVAKRTTQWQSFQKHKLMSEFTGDELKHIFELAYKKKAFRQKTSEELGPLGYSEADILEVAREMGISDSCIREAIEQAPMYKSLKRCRRQARLLRIVGLTALLLFFPVVGAWRMNGMPTSFAVPMLLISGGVSAIAGWLYRHSYEKAIEIEMDLSLDDGKVISDELAFSSYVERMKRSWRAPDVFVPKENHGFIANLCYLIIPPTPALVRHEINLLRKGELFKEPVLKQSKDKDNEHSY